MQRVKEAKTKSELEAIFQLRFRILREPWGKELQSASDEFEEKSVNAYIGQNGVVIACGRLQQNEGGVGQIRYMAVEKGHRDRGLGRLIVDFLEEKARSLGMNTIQLQARENALEFYKRCGYTLKESSFLLWDQIQHYLMEKKL